jgi:peroxiredoxin
LGVRIVLNRIIPVTTIALLLIACAIVPALAAVPIGQTAPDFQLNDLSGNAHKLSSFQGKVVVIDFFENTCGGCQDDAKNKLVPLFNNYYKNNANVQFLSVEVTGASAAQIQSTYLTATGTIPWPILTNGQTIWTSYNTGVGVPTLYVIDPAGKVAAVMQYPTDVQKLKSTIDQYAGSGGFLPNTGPAVSSWAAERLDVFMVGTDHALWHKWYQSGLGWSAWESLGGSLTSSPAAVSWSNGRIDVFARGSDGTLQHKWFSGGWSGWESLGGQLASGTGPAVSSWAPGRLDIFTTGTDGALKHLWFSGGWSNWESLGGSLTSSPAAVSWGAGRIDVFARGSDGIVNHKWFSAGWYGWESLGGY